MSVISPTGKLPITLFRVTNDGGRGSNWPEVVGEKNPGPSAANCGAPVALRNAVNGFTPCVATLPEVPVRMAYPTTCCCCAGVIKGSSGRFASMNVFWADVTGTNVCGAG